jgi:hypothetical protein
MSVADLGGILEAGMLAIAFIDRGVFDLRPQQRIRLPRHCGVSHTVVPTRVTTATVTYLDPLPPAVARRSRPIFELAHQRLANYCVVATGLR